MLLTNSSLYNNINDFKGLQVLLTICLSGEDYALIKLKYGFVLLSV